MATLASPALGLMRRRRLRTLAGADAQAPAPAMRATAPKTASGPGAGFVFPTVGGAGTPGGTGAAGGGTTPVNIGGATGNISPQPAPQPVQTTINTQVDPNVTAAYGAVQDRINFLKGSENDQLDPAELQRRITLANSTAADAAQGEKASNAERAAILGRGKEGAELFDRRTDDQLQRTMARSGEEITADEQRRIDDRNEARRRELDSLMFEQLNASTVAPRLALSQQDQALRALEGDRGYGLSLEELRQRGMDRDWARQQALSQMSLDTAADSYDPYAPVVGSGGGGGFFGGGSGGGSGHGWFA